MIYYVIAKGDILVGVDSSSGGYPFKTTNLQGARLWASYNEAKKYLSSFNNLDGLLAGFQVKELWYKLVNIDKSPVFHYKRRNRTTGMVDNYRITRDELDRLYGEDCTFQTFLSRMNSYDPNWWYYN